MHSTFVADIVQGRGRGLTSDRVRKDFGEGRVLPAAEALRRGMIDRVFPTTAVAYSYAVGYQANAQVRADMNSIDFKIAEIGTDADRQAAFKRIRERQVDPHDQHIADADYVAAGIRRAERYLRD
ncbi:hypothetical protein BH18ACI5_BH18ACI5_04430 [soil metagenome]